VIRYKSINGVQTFEELCEHCREIVSDVHISEITFKAAHLNEITLTMKDASNNDYVLKSFTARKEEILIARMAAGMITASGATTESLKYRLRSERMCSSSAAVDEEFCYRTTHPKFLRKYLERWEIADRVQTGSAGGLKLGIGRTGTIKRIKSESISVGQQIQWEDADFKWELAPTDIDVDRYTWDGVDTIKYHGPWKQSWFRDLSEAQKQVRIDEEALLTDIYIEDSDTVDAWQEEIGD